VAPEQAGRPFALRYLDLANQQGRISNRLKNFNLQDLKSQLINSSLLSSQFESYLTKEF
jgi:hypothetical protein